MKNRRRLLWLAVWVAAGLTVASVTDARGFRHYLRMRQDVAQLRERNDQLREHNAGLYREIESLRTDPVALERAAREELGFIRPDEILMHVE